MQKKDLKGSKESKKKTPRFRNIDAPTLNPFLSPSWGNTEIVLSLSQGTKHTGKSFSRYFPLTRDL